MLSLVLQAANLTIYQFVLRVCLIVALFFVILLAYYKAKGKSEE